MISESYWSRIAQENEIYNFDFLSILFYFYRRFFNFWFLVEFYKKNGGAGPFLI